MTERETNAAKVLGRKGGRSKSDAKARAARENGKKGGRPPELDRFNDEQPCWDHGETEDERLRRLR